MDSRSQKRKRTVLSIAQKLEICEALNKQTATGPELAEKYNVIINKNIMPFLILIIIIFLFKILFYV